MTSGQRRYDTYLLSINGLTALDMTMRKAKCDRCGITRGVFRMSMFNLDWCCELCITIERRHPKWLDARDREANEVNDGNLNYEGIGLPPKYDEWAELELKYDPELQELRDSLITED